MSVYKKNIILLVILTICFALTIAYGFGFRNSIHQPKLPAKYSRYKSIDSSASSKNYEIKQVLNGQVNGLYFDPPMLVKNVLIIHAESDNSDKPRNSYYKIDHQGNLIDSLIYNDEQASSFQNGYLIHQNYYRTWALTGDTSKHTYLPLNFDLKLDSPAILNQFFNLNAKATASQFIKYTYLWDNNDQKFKHKIDKVLFLISNQWYAFYGANLYDHEPHKKSTSTDKLPNQLKGKQILGTADHIFQVAYFYKTNRGLTNANDWNGQAYINLRIGTDTLKIKHEMELNEKTKTYNYNNLKLYEQPNSNLKLIGNGRTEFYVIKPKSK